MECRGKYHTFDLNISVNITSAAIMDISFKSTKTMYILWRAFHCEESLWYVCKIQKTIIGSYNKFDLAFMC